MLYLMRLAQLQSLYQIVCEQLNIFTMEVFTDISQSLYFADSPPYVLERTSKYLLMSLRTIFTPVIIHLSTPYDSTLTCVDSPPIANPQPRQARQRFRRTPQFAAVQIVTESSPKRPNHSLRMYLHHFPGDKASSLAVVNVRIICALQKVPRGLSSMGCPRQHPACCKLQTAKNRMPPADTR